MKSRIKTFIAFVAGAAGAVVAFGVLELIHGLYELVPSVPVAVSQRIIELTPGALATAGISTLGKAATPILVTFVVIFTLLLSGLLARLALRNMVAALAGVAALGVAALLAAFSEPAISPFATIATVVGALAAGAAVTGALLREANPQESGGPDGAGESGLPDSPVVRSRGTGETGIAVDRRGFLVLAGTAAAGGVAAVGVGRALAGGSSEAATSPGSLDDSLPSGGTTGDSTGGSTNGGSTGGTTSPAPTRVELPPPAADASIDAPGMPELITPADDFYLIDTAISSPRINRDRWTMSVMGAVDNPYELTYEDLVSSFDVLEADVTMSCVSNEVGGSLVSHGRWTGVRLSDVLAEAGVSRDKLNRRNEQLVGRSVDDWTGGFRTELALDGREALVAFGLNGDELPVNHGYPARLIIPGLYGYVSATKWLREIELTDWGFDAYWIRRGWSKNGPVKTQSRIDTVQRGQRLSAGNIPIGGVAWAPTRGIERVEVSTDDGDTWNDARLATQLDPDAWRQYVYDWNAEPGEHTIKVRATDGEGETQTEDKNPPAPSGATGYHTVRVNVS